MSNFLPHKVVQHDPEQWEPGMPLYTRDPYSQYLFNFRDEDDIRLREDDCICPDRASWPKPTDGRWISEDPLAPFIHEYRRWRKEQEGG